MRRAVAGNWAEHSNTILHNVCVLLMLSMIENQLKLSSITDLFKANIVSNIQW